MKFSLRSTATLYLGYALTSVCKFAKLIQLKNREEIKLFVTLKKICYFCIFLMYTRIDWYTLMGTRTDWCKHMTPAQTSTRKYSPAQTGNKWIFVQIDLLYSYRFKRRVSLPLIENPKSENHLIELKFTYGYIKNPWILEHNFLLYLHLNWPSF